MIFDDWQGKCLAEHHSLHVTISSYQLNSWTDLLEKLLPAALAVASQEDEEFRQVGYFLPICIYIGSQHIITRAVDPHSFLSGSGSSFSAQCGSGSSIK